MSNIGAHAKHGGKRVELLGNTIHIDDLAVPLNEAAEYLREIPTEKRELAFVHAVQVGMAEIMARRRRFARNGRSALTLVAPPAVDAGKAAGTDSSKGLGPVPPALSERQRVEGPVPPALSERQRAEGSERQRVEGPVPSAPACPERAQRVEGSERSESCGPEEQPVNGETRIETQASVGVSSARETVAEHSRNNEETREPTAEIAAERSSETHVIPPLQEPDGWLKRLDEHFEILDKLQALDASKTGR